MSRSPNRRHSWLGPALLLLGLAPTLTMAVQGLEVTPSYAEDSLRARRAKILAKIASDPTVLINVKRRDMPGSPDILDLGKRSTAALQRCLADNVNASVRSDCALMLETLADRRALKTLQAALEDWDDNVRYHAVRALAVIPDGSSVEPLLKLYRRKDESQRNRMEVISALGTMSDMRVIRQLRKDLRNKPADDEADLRDDIFDALWAGRHLMGRATLIGDVRYCLRSKNNSLIHSATLAAVELRSPLLVDALIPLLEHPWPDVRNKAVYGLGKIGDKKATKALLAHLPKVREARMLNNIAFALERLDKEAFYQSIEKVIGHKQAIIRLNAAFVLGDVRHAEGRPLLEKALGDASDFVKTSAIAALGKLQTQESIKPLEGLIADPNIAVREEAIYALHSLTEGGRSDLIHDKLFKLPWRKYPRTIRRAALTLAKTGDGRVQSYLLSCLEHYNCRRRDVAAFLRKHPSQSAAGRLLLAWARGRQDLTGLIAEHKPSGTRPIATSALEASWKIPRSSTSRAAVDLLGYVGDQTSQGLLNKRVKTKHTTLRVHVLVALARLGDEAATAALLKEMDQLPAEWFPTFVRTMGQITEPAVIALLEPELEQRQSHQDPYIALAAAAVRLGWQPDKAIFRFLQALGSTQSYERELAELYLSRARAKKVTWLLRRALAREGDESVRDRLRGILDRRPR